MLNLFLFQLAKIWKKKNAEIKSRGEYSVNALYACSVFDCMNVYSIPIISLYDEIYPTLAKTSPQLGRTSVGVQQSESATLSS